MWHSHLNDMEIPETKRFIPKGNQDHQLVHTDVMGLREFLEKINTYFIFKLLVWPTSSGFLLSAIRWHL